MLTPCWPRAGPTGGAGVAWPPGHWSFTFAVITLAIVVSRAGRGGGEGRLDAPRAPGPAVALLGSDPFHLPVFEVDRRRPVEDDQHDLDQPSGLDDLLDGPLEVLERAVLDLDPVAALDVDPDPRGFLGLGRLLAEHLVDFGLGHLGRRAVGADEVADAGRLADGEPGLLVQLHLDHDVAGIALSLDDPLLVVADLGDLLGRDHDPAEEALEALDLDPALQGVADGILPAALHLQDVPDQ